MQATSRAALVTRGAGDEGGDELVDAVLGAVSYTHLIHPGVSDLNQPRPAAQPEHAGEQFLSLIHI